MHRLQAAFIFFTRLPFWRIWTPPQSAFARVVELWPFVGWLTGGVAALVCWSASMVLPLWVAVVLALGARTLLTGGLHEDGLADFFDGFGGGASREAVLRIMKDSHIGTYGVLGLIFYYLLGVGALSSLPPTLAAAVLFASDAWGKCVAAQVINALPYARKESEAKSRTIYTPMGGIALMICTFGGVLPALLCLPPLLWWGCAGAAVVGALLIGLMHRRLQGYTGDCCGALFLLSELAMWLVITAICTYLAR